MKILALDQATKTGFAVVKYTGEVVCSGVWELADPKRSGESRGMRYVRFRQYLTEMFIRHDVDLVVHEQTLLRGGAATEIANGLKALILEASVVNGAEVTCVHTSELKKFATGSGKADKVEMVAACRKLTSVEPKDDNEADAVLIGLWAAAKFGDYPAPEWLAKEPVKKKSKKKFPLNEFFG